MTLCVSELLSDIFPDKKSFVDRYASRGHFRRETLDHTLTRLKDAGFDGIELVLSRHFTLAAVHEVGDLLAPYDLKVISIHEPLGSVRKTQLSQVEAYCDAAIAVGAKIVVVHLSNTGRQVLSPAYAENIRTLERQFNLVIGFENGHHLIFRPREHYSWQPAAIGPLFDEKKLHMTLDTTHIGQAKGDLVDFYRRHQSNIVNIHLSDYRRSAMQNSVRPTAGMHLPIGRGILPLVPLLLELKRDQYQGNITLEISAGLDDIGEGARLVRSAFGT